MEAATEQRGLRQLWADPPWTIKAFAALELVGIVLSLITPSFSSDGTMLQDYVVRIAFWAAVSGLLIYWLFRGSRLVWVILTIWVGFSIVSSLMLTLVPTGDSYASVWMWVALTVSQFVLLMHPLTRAWCKRKLHLEEPDQPVPGGSPQDLASISEGDA